MVEKAFIIRKAEKKDSSEVYDLWAESILVDLQNFLFWAFMTQDRCKFLFLQTILTCVFFQKSVLIGSSINIGLFFIFYFACKLKYLNKS